MHVCCLRPALVYGPGVKGNLLRMMGAVDAGRFPPVPDTGNRRSMVHVDDLVQAAKLAAEKPAANGKTYIVTDGRNYSTREMYVMMAETLGRKVPSWTVPAWLLRGGGYIGDLIGRITGRRFPVDSEAIARLLGSACYSSRKIELELGYRPVRDLGSALPEMVESYRKHAPG
jgi:nucleoside-diphosphate-sugar epimerase